MVTENLPYFNNMQWTVTEKVRKSNSAGSSVRNEVEDVLDNLDGYSDKYPQ